MASQNFCSFQDNNSRNTAGCVGITFQKLILKEYIQFKVEGFREEYAGNINGVVLRLPTLLNMLKIGKEL